MMVIRIFFLLSRRRLDIDCNTVSKSRSIVNNQPTKLSATRKLQMKFGFRLGSVDLKEKMFEIVNDPRQRAETTLTSGN